MERAEVQVEFEPRFCSNHVVDLTAGCSFGCVYCPFAEIGARRRGVTRPTALDLPDLRGVTTPPSIFLSPASDPFAPQAATRTHGLLARLLPRGTRVGILTKGIVPERTLDLLAGYPMQIEGIGVGVTSLDDRRNRVLEPGCPPALERLENLDRISARGLPSAIRIDPMFPGLDDTVDALEELLDEAAGRRARAVTATYVFAWGRSLRRLRSEPLLAESVPLLTEPTPMEGGTALSVSLERKLATYSQLVHMARARGLYFNTCGCKDLRIRDAQPFPTRCRNPNFFSVDSLTRTVGSPELTP